MPENNTSGVHFLHRRAGVFPASNTPRSGGFIDESRAEFIGPLDGRLHL
jgi:hypothetical protein